MQGRSARTQIAGSRFRLTKSELAREGNAAQEKQKSQKSFEKSFFAVDDGGDQANFAIPLNTGFPQSQDRRSWFSQILGLQIGTQFCPG
ncbi:MAG: hypothetical protein ACR2MW_00660, partial [Chthoniobacterales bacterium]